MSAMNLSLLLFAFVFVTAIGGHPYARSRSLGDIICSSVCPNEETCCKLISGEYVCCTEGYECDDATGTCKRPSSVSTHRKTVMVNKQSSFKPDDIVCPDGSSECPADNTCCMVSSSKYGCCPIPNAVCCSNRKNCCPEGYICSGSDGVCTRSVKKQQSSSSTVKNILCPDGSSVCPDKNTCCKVSTDLYDCCPTPNAICCSDDKHCCPEGHTCNTADGTFSKSGSIAVPVFKKQPSIGRVKSVACPDGTSQCPAENTCCKLSSGRYGCCLHGSICDNGACQETGFTLPISATRNAL